MKFHIIDLPKLAFQRRPSAALGLIIIAMVCASVFFAYKTDLEEDYRGVELRNQTRPCTH
jgi:hypothetical protein